MRKTYDEIGKMDFPTRALTRAQQAHILDGAMARIGQTGHAPARHRLRLRWKLAVAAAALCCLCAGGVAAAGYLLSPAQVAGQLDQPDLSALFAGPDAVEVQQTQQAGNYTVTLLGLTGGENVTGYWSSGWGADAPPADRSYAVLAVTHTDGTPMAALDDAGSDLTLTNSIVSPLLAAPDCPVAEYNVFTMNGARHDLVAGGVRYILVETDGIEPFADKEPQLAVVLGQGGISALTGGFAQDPATGAITPKAEGEAACLLFDLPIDPALADPTRAQELRDQWFGPAQEGTQPGTLEQAMDDTMAALADLTPEQVRTKGTLQDRQTVSLSDGICGEGWYYGDGGFAAKELLPDSGQETVAVADSEGNVTLLARNGDGTLTVETWRLPLA